MKVSELANELGTTSKEILEIIKKNDPSAKMFAATKLTDSQESAVRGALAGKKAGALKPETAAPKAEAQKTEAPKADGAKAEAARTEGAAQPAKKKLTAVFRPQNAQQQIKRPVPKNAPSQNRSQSFAGAKAQAAEGSGRPAAEGERSQGGFQGSRDGRDSRDGGRQGSREGRDGGRQGGFQGNREGRDGGRQGGNRDSRGGRDGSRQGGFQGSRDGNRSQGGYGQNRFGGGRDGADKDRDSRDNRGGRDGNRRQGSRDGGKVSFDAPIQTKPTSGRQQNKNAHKNDRFDKREHEEEAKGKNSRSGKTGKGAFIMPQPKKEEAKVEDIKTIVIPETLTIRELAEIPVPASFPRDRSCLKLPEMVELKEHLIDLLRKQVTP